MANYGGSLYLNYRKKNINTHATLRNDNENNLRSKISKTDYTKSNLVIDEDEISVEKPKKYYAQVGIDYEINKRNSLNLTSNFSFKKINEKVTNNLSYRNSLNTTDSIIDFTEDQYSVKVWFNDLITSKIH